MTKKAMLGLQKFGCYPLGSQAGKQRFKCKSCGIFFTNNRPEQRLRNRFCGLGNGCWKDRLIRLFAERQWILQGYAAKDFYQILESSPVLKIIKREKVNLRMDATYFAQFCLVAYQDDLDGYTQLIRFTDGEHYEEIKEDLANLFCCWE